MLTILVYAQEESRSVSENCKWRIRKRFQAGELVSLRFMFGYRVVKGKVTVDEREAAIVRMILAIISVVWEAARLPRSLKR